MKRPPWLLSSSDGVVVLDVQVTPELEQEGLARDLVRLVQMTRKDAGLHIADRIALSLDVPSEFQAAIEPHQAFVCSETLAVDVRYGANGDAADDYRGEHNLQGQAVTIGVRRVEQPV